ncbi:MAG: hypothetical protein NTV19_05735 [Burkholderiales bacterium]|nr:hypothetical protein [Burkholderiales bacterium]
MSDDIDFMLCCVTAILCSSNALPRVFRRLATMRECGSERNFRADARLDPDHRMHRNSPSEAMQPTSEPPGSAGLPAPARWVKLESPTLR